MTVYKIVNGQRMPLDIELPPRWIGGREKINVRSEFIMYDGEACQDTDYCLFGNSKGDEICVPRQLTSVELIEFLMECARKYPKAFHIGYGFDYDIDKILWDLPKHKLAMLKDLGKVRHRFRNGVTYEINYIPGKSIAIKERIRTRDSDGHIREATGACIRIDDVVSYFRTRYDKALAKYGIGTKAELESMARDKERRADFWYKDIEEIKTYFRLELRLGPPLMEVIKKAVYSAGYKIGQWHGPGAIAKAMLRKHNISQYMAPSPDHITELALRAFSAGRFERFKIGYYEGPVYQPDINSAHPWGISQLPNLARGSWRYVKNPNPNWTSHYRMGLWHIRYTIPGWAREGLWHDIPFPLFQRKETGHIFYPMDVDNWYHSPEAALVANDPYADFIEAWLFEDDGSYPFEWIAEDYELRQALIVEQNPAQYGIKLGMNSVFGSLAQRVGWDRKKRIGPRWHQIEWAGLVTSYTKSLVFPAAIDVGQCGGLISIDTDSVTAIVEPRNLPHGVGNQLGRWGMKTYTGILYLSNGNYWLRDDNGDWLEPKVRGYSGDAKVPTIEIGIETLKHGVEMGPFRSYVGFKRALAQGWNKRGQWLNETRKFEPHFASKFRPHMSLLCPECARDIPPWETLHSCMIYQHPRALNDSQIHNVPWREPDRMPELMATYRKYLEEMGNNDYA